MKKIVIFSLLCFHLSAASVYADRDRDNNRRDRDLYEKNKMRLQQKKRDLQRRNYSPNVYYNTPNYHQYYYYEHEYEQPYYYE